MAKKIEMYRCKCKKIFETEEAADACCRIPTPLPKPDIEALRDMVSKYIQDLAVGKRAPFIEHEAYTRLIETFYGPKVWWWINNR